MLSITLWRCMMKFALLFCEVYFTWCRSEKEMNRRKDMLLSLRSKVNQMASTLNMSNSSNRDSLLGPEGKPDAMARTVGLDNIGLVGFQRKIMKGHLMRLLENISLSLFFGSNNALLFKQNKTRALSYWKRL